MEVEWFLSSNYVCCSCLWISCETPTLQNIPYEEKMKAIQFNLLFLQFPCMFVFSIKVRFSLFFWIKVISSRRIFKLCQSLQFNGSISSSTKMCIWNGQSDIRYRFLWAAWLNFTVVFHYVSLSQAWLHHLWWQKRVRNWVRHLVTQYGWTRIKPLMVRWRATYPACPN